MKTLSKWPGRTLLVLLGALLLSQCTEPEVEPDDGDDDPQVVTPAEADRILESLMFTTKTKVSGSMPTVANTSLAKMNSGDTIFVQPGMQMPLRISSPATSPAKGWFITVENASFYLDVPVDDTEDETEEGEDVSNVIIEFPEDFYLGDFSVSIMTYKEGKEPIDVIKRKVVVEKPEAPGSTCSLLKTDPTVIWDWSWQSTIVWNPNGFDFMNTPGRLFKASQLTTGCCNPQAACPAYVCDPVTLECNWEYNAIVNAFTFYSIQSEYFNFFPDGNFTRATKERIKNFNPDPNVTDWCGGIAGYNMYAPLVHYYGTHDYQDGDANIVYITERTDCDDPLGICGYGSRPGSVKVSCHVLVITIDRMQLDFTKEQRIYWRRSAIDWHD